MFSWSEETAQNNLFVQQFKTKHFRDSSRLRPMIMVENNAEGQHTSYLQACRAHIEGFWLPIGIKGSGSNRWFCYEERFSTAINSSDSQNCLQSSSAWVADQLPNRTNRSMKHFVPCTAALAVCCWDTFCCQFRKLGKDWIPMESLILPFAMQMTPTSTVTIYCCRLNPSDSAVFTSWRGLMACCSVFVFHRIRVIKQPDWEHFRLLTFLISQALPPAALHKGMPKHC